MVSMYYMLVIYFLLYKHTSFLSILVSRMPMSTCVLTCHGLKDTVSPNSSSSKRINNNVYT